MLHLVKTITKITKEAAAFLVAKVTLELQMPIYLQNLSASLGNIKFY